MKKLFIFILPAILLVSCAKNLGDYNIDQKKPTTAPPVTLFSNATKSLADIITSPSVNNNVFRFFVQQWTTTIYLDEPTYNITTRNISANFWTPLYRDVLADYNEAERLLQLDKLIDPNTKNNQIAQLEIMQVYTWLVLVNTFGNVPYSEALNINNTAPKYDDAKEIYGKLQVRLDKALALLNATGTGFGSGDLVYSGAGAGFVDKWKKFGNSIKLKMGLILADSDPGTAKTMIEAAAPNVFTSNADNARFLYATTTPNNNPVSNNLNATFTNRQDYVPANTLVDQMNTLGDPRRQFYFTLVKDNTLTPPQMVYKGGTYGVANTFNEVSNVSAKIIAPDFEALFLDYSEVEFALAEAVERGFTVGGTPDSHYNNAITASIKYWGGAQADVDAYLLKPAVAYATATGTYKQKIGMQKWIALYNRGYDSWVEWRRLDYPVFALPPFAVSGVPVRMTYPINEQTLNGASYSQAASAIGGDKVATKLFWDKF